ncbi:dihydrolipoamide acetyltransferase family protein [Pontibacter pamirensis]|uniref:dihydrolipoamide acetyltransferase family protein n=1 Tax=Pontibacter pamirensis TaxID=2562824 RepID=UPI00138A2FFD|nr:dihydrolipoamide acetyltransferase family protein [Pontibacter pamirensis]
MALVEMVMPKMGESIMEGTVLKWLKSVGDTIEQDESVLEVATDKVDTEVPALEAGVLKEILVQEGDVVAVGAPIAIISTNGEDTGSSDPATTEAPATATEEEIPQQTVAASAQTESAVAKLDQPASGRFYSPLVLNIAREEGISMQELEYIPGTGKEGRVSKKDIMAYVDNRSEAPQQATEQVNNAPQQAQTHAPAAPKPAAAPQPQAASVKPAASYSGNVEIIEMDRMRKMIADRMVESKQTSPHVTSFVEADVTNIVNWRNKWKNEYKKREGENLTFTPIMIEAVVKAIKDFPMINVSVDGNRIIRHKDINVGMAVALPSGNLIVPNIKNADQMNLNGLTKKVNDLANRGRINKLTPDDLSGGTYTVSNVGSFGNVMGTPIIMQPQVAIMALGAITKKPAVIETPQGDLIGIRHFMFLSHSYDHRVVDGSLGGMFVRRVADYLENFDVDQTI